MRLPVARWRRRRVEPIYVAACYAVAIVYALLVIVPVFFVVVSSFKSTTEIFSAPLALPSRWTLAKYVKAVQVADLVRATAYSVDITAASEVATLLLAFPAAYAIARIRTRLAAMTEIIFSVGFLIPAFAMLVPVYLIMSTLGLVYNPFSLILFYPATRLPLSVILLASYLREIPREMEESAEIDGASRLSMIRHIFFPLAQPGLATVVVLNFLAIWNEFLFALVLLSSDNRTVQVAATVLKNERVIDFGLVAAGVVISSLPMFLVFAFFQEKIVAGLTAGAVTG